MQTSYRRVREELHFLGSLVAAAVVGADVEVIVSAADAEDVIELDVELVDASVLV